MGLLNDKSAIVTGGGSGIGLATARLLLEQGARVAIIGRNQAKLDEAVKHLGHSDRLVAIAADLADPASVDGMVKKVLARFKNIDILVNNAGTNLKERKFRELTAERWQYMLRANLDSAFFCTHAVFPNMAERQDGIVVNISSVAGKRATPLGGIAYAASKFGMTALGIGLGAEEKDSGIRVTNIYPGEVDTPILEFRPSPVTESHRASMLQPDDVARAVLFVVTQPKHVSIPEMIIKPQAQVYV